MSADWSTQVLQYAKALVEARRSGQFLEEASAVADVSEAYMVQAATIHLAPEAGLGELVGWKCGPCRRADQEKNGVAEPGRAPIFKENRWESPAKLEYIPGGYPSSPTHFEAEIGFLLKDSLPRLPTGQLYSEDDVWAAVDSVVLCMEVCATRYSVPLRGDLHFFQKMADCTNNLGVVVGDRISKVDLESPASLSEIEVTMSTNGQKAAEGRGSDGVVEDADGKGSPFQSLLWLANHLQKTHDGLKSGEVVICGAACLIREKDFSFNDENVLEVAATFGKLGKAMAIVSKKS
eukprot:TRINITY_DN25420_c0_g1_i2.p1 TRINITY_DN25420_c0_g1~~TRINITY_DN25420_c0_g1_i2.p1  ORF type:complete len:292 (+),score=63.19 TRINITY_DN25420_c0_g1_i2:105-980(+)